MKGLLLAIFLVCTGDFLITFDFLVGITIVGVGIAIGIATVVKWIINYFRSKKEDNKN